MTKTEVVNQFYVSLAKGDFEKVSSLLSDDLVWHQPGKGSLSGTYEGKEAVFSHLEECLNSADDRDRKSVV